jgi:hypothetical protein
MSDALPPVDPATPAFPEAIRQFRHDIGDVGPIPQTLPRPSRTLPRLRLKSGQKRKLGVILGLLILVAAGIRIAPLLSGPDVVPAELLGSWTTDDRRYDGRHLELTPSTLTLRTSAREGTEYDVRRVQRQAIAQGSAYVITTHSEQAGDYILLLEYHDAQRTIGLGKPARGLWRRAR